MRVTRTASAAFTAEFESEAELREEYRVNLSVGGLRLLTAEAVALERAGDAARGATLWVTLEPCSHTGRTAPCADALVAAGVRRVVVAIDDPDPRVQLSVALNENLGAMVLALLATSADAHVRQAVALNPHTPADLLQQLAPDVDARVRQAVVLNPNTPLSVMEGLRDDPDQGVREVARGYLDRLLAWQSEG